MHLFIARFVVCLFFFMASTNAIAQDTPAMADIMRSNGKIYVVVAVCLTILIGLFLYVFMLDKKIKKLEKETNHKTNNSRN